MSLGLRGPSSAIAVISLRAAIQHAKEPSMRVTRLWEGPEIIFSEAMRGKCVTRQASLILREHIAGISAKTATHTTFILSQYLCYTPGCCTSPFGSPPLPVIAASGFGNLRLTSPIYGSAATAPPLTGDTCDS